jgi:hypothetical protein
MSERPAMDAVDKAILVRFGELARAADPAPEITVELGRAAFALRRLDAELAELVADSVLESSGLSGVRGQDDARLLSFEAGGVGVELEVREPPRGRTLLGQVVADDLGPVSVRLEAADGRTLAATVDEVGGFRFDGVAPGPVRLHIERPGAAPVTTSWVNV